MVLGKLFGLESVFDESREVEWNKVLYTLRFQLESREDDLLIPFLEGGGKRAIRKSDFLVFPFFLSFPFFLFLLPR
jgi:hypothetical protein